MADECSTCFYVRPLGIGWACHRREPDSTTAGGEQWQPVLATDWCGEFSATGPSSTTLHVDPVAFINLPVAPSVGDIACINDSSVNVLGGVAAGGGGFVVLVWYNGVTWTICGI